MNHIQTTISVKRNTSVTGGDTAHVLGVAFNNDSRQYSEVIIGYLASPEEVAQHLEWLAAKARARAKHS